MSDETHNAQFENFEREKDLRKTLANLRIQRAMKDLEIRQIEARIEECQAVAADHKWQEWLEENERGDVTQGQIRPRHLSVVPPPAAAKGDGLEIPEGFTKWDGGEWTGNPRDAVQVIFHDEPTPYFTVEADELQPLWNWSKCSPDAQRIVAYQIVKAADLLDAPAPDFAAENAAPEAHALNADMQDEREEPAPHVAWDRVGGGYAPVTNPEADALARAHDYYSPEKIAERQKFNPWGGVSNLFGKPKVDA